MKINTSYHVRAHCFYKGFNGTGYFTQFWR